MLNENSNSNISQRNNSHKDLSLLNLDKSIIKLERKNSNENHLKFQTNNEMSVNEKQYLQQTLQKAKLIYKELASSPKERFNFPLLTHCKNAQTSDSKKDLMQSSDIVDYQMNKSSS